MGHSFRLRKATLLLSAGVLLACEGLTLDQCGSALPLGDPREAVYDPRLIGTWQSEDPDDEGGEIHVLRFSDVEYLVETQDPEEPGVLHWRAFVIMVESVPFIDVQLIQMSEDEARRHFFFRYEFDGPDRVVLRAVSDGHQGTFDGYASSAEIRQFLGNNLDRTDIYEDAVVFVRKTEA